MDTSVDQVARDNAARALAMILAHERICEEREKASVSWRSHVAEKLDGINANIKALYNRNWVVACSAIVLLLGVCGYLIDNKGL